MLDSPINTRAFSRMSQLLIDSLSHILIFFAQIFCCPNALRLFRLTSLWMIRQKLNKTTAYTQTKRERCSRANQESSRFTKVFLLRMAQYPWNQYTTLVTSYVTKITNFTWRKKRTNLYSVSVIYLKNGMTLNDMIGIVFVISRTGALSVILSFIVYFENHIVQPAV